MKKSSLIPLLLCLSIAAFAQGNFEKGFVVELSGDTLHGFCFRDQTGGGYSVGRFKKDVNGAETRYLPDAIRGYGFAAGSYYMSEPTHNQFMEVIVAGKATLLMVRAEFFAKDATGIYPLKNTEKQVESGGLTKVYESKEYLGILKWMLADCPKLQSKIERTKLAPVGLTKLFSAYNICTGSTPGLVTRHDKFLQIELGPVAYYTQIKLDHVGASTPAERETFGTENRLSAILDVPEFSKTSMVNYGVKFSAYSPRVMSQISLFVELLYGKAVFKSSAVFEREAAFRRNNSVTATVHYIRLPIGLQYHFRSAKKKVIPFVLAGMVMNQLSTPSPSQDVSRYLVGTVRTADIVYRNTFSIIPAFVSLTGGAGVKINLANRFSCSAVFKYESGIGPFQFTPSSVPDSYENSKQRLLSGGINVAYSF